MSPTQQPPTGDDGAPSGGALPELDLVEEARRIAGVVQDWLEEGTSRLADAEPADTDHDTGHGHRSGPDCEWCPLCRLAAALRTERPEIKEKIADAATALSSVLRSLMDAAAAHSGSAPADEAAGAGGAADGSPDAPDAPQAPDAPAQQPEQPRPRPRPGPGPA